jgi:hypothetical protein
MDVEGLVNAKCLKQSSVRLWRVIIMNSSIYVA